MLPQKRRCEVGQRVWWHHIYYSQTEAMKHRVRVDRHDGGHWIVAQGDPLRVLKRLQGLHKPKSVFKVLSISIHQPQSVTAARN